MDEKGQYSTGSGDITRISALEKEVARLKSNTKKQSSRYYRLKRWSIFQIFFFLILLLMMTIYGMLQWPSGASIPSLFLPQSKPDTIVIRDTIALSYRTIDLEQKRQEDALIFEVPEDGILYSIQIGAYTGIDMTPYQLNMLSVYQYSYESINQLTAGLFQDYNNANKFLQLIIQMGFEDAFIVATRHGRRISVQEALALQNSNQPSEGFTF